MAKTETSVPIGNGPPEKSMSNAAKLFVNAVIVTGIVVVLASISQWRCENPTAYSALLALGLLASLCKVRLPGITGTYSLAFYFVLIAIFDFSAPEAVLLGAASAATQCLYRPKRRPLLRSVLFSTSGVAISVMLAERIYKLAISVVPGGAEVGAITLAATAYWFINTGLVSAALAMVAEGTVAKIWQHWCLSTMPYYILGAALSIPASMAVQSGNWRGIVFVLPALGLLYFWWRVSVGLRSREHAEGGGSAT